MFDWFINKKYLTSSGSVEGLDHFLCLNGRRRTELIASSQESDSGHNDLCLNHTNEDRLAIKEFLKHWD